MVNMCYVVFILSFINLKLSFIYQNIDTRKVGESFYLSFYTNPLNSFNSSNFFDSKTQKAGMASFIAEYFRGLSHSTFFC